jgi:hypothetical protein
MSMPLPTLSSTAKLALDNICSEMAYDARYPAAFAAVVNTKEFIYENQTGQVDSFDATKGAVNQDTGKS